MVEVRMTEIIELPISCKTVHKIQKYIISAVDNILYNFCVFLGGVVLALVSMILGHLFYIATHPLIAKLQAPGSICPEMNWFMALIAGLLTLLLTICIIFSVCDVEFTCKKETS
jgi:hypothetical protein